MAANSAIETGTCLTMFLILVKEKDPTLALDVADGVAES
jgi:hypothetical protein